MTAAIAACPICREPLAGKPTWAVGPTVFCERCFRSDVDPKRLARMGRSLAALRADTLENRHRQMREAVAERDHYRREAEQVKAGLRAEVRAEVVAAVRRLSVWQRIKLCFSPYAVSF